MPPISVPRHKMTLPSIVILEFWIGPHKAELQIPLVVFKEHLLCFPTHLFRNETENAEAACEHRIVEDGFGWPFAHIFGVEVDCMLGGEKLH